MLKRELKIGLKREGLRKKGLSGERERARELKLKRENYIYL